MQRNLEEPDPLYTLEFFKSKDVQRVYDKYAKACYEYEKRIRKVKQAQKSQTQSSDKEGEDKAKTSPITITE